MSLEQFLHLLRNRWKLIAICCLFLGAGAALGSSLLTPIYQSTALVEVTAGSGNNESEYTSLLASQQLVQTEAVLATSDPVLREVASHYKGLTADQLANEVTATPRVNTQLFEIDVQDPDPAMAATLANDVATTLAKQQVQMTLQGTTQSTLVVIQNASPALRPIRPNILLNTGGGLLAGLLAGVLLAVVLERLAMGLLTPENITQLLNWPVIGTIWYTSSKRQEDVINPKRPDPNVESCRMLCTSIRFAVADKSVPLLMVTSALPGEGKSTIAANLAIFMARTGKNTLLIDANIYHPMVQKLFNLLPESEGLSHAILAYSSIQNVPKLLAQRSDQPHTELASQGDSSTEPSIESFMHSVSIPNLWVMPSGPFMPNLPELLDSEPMQKLLKVITKSGMDFVIFDAPALLSASNASTLASEVDGVLVVVDMKSADKGHLEQMKDLLARTQARVLGCIANKQRHNPKDTAVYYQTDPESSENVVIDAPKIDRCGDDDQITQKLIGSSTKSNPE